MIQIALFTHPIIGNETKKKELPVENESNFEKLYQKYAKAIFWICKRYVKQTEDAEDMVHQTFLKAWQNWSGFRNDSVPYTWLYRIAVNECLQTMRKSKVELDLDSCENMPELEEELELTKDNIFNLVKNLAEPEIYMTIVLIYVEGMSQEQACAMAGISRMTLHRKFNTLKQQTRKELFHDTGK